ncbi:MAG: bifunctional (p)ppGpp synthetase/guanosine-3',5'-bis(diphosphate) 3'-pyrophosphohydrolase [Saprospiraceae bacterium]|nr:bifunctional (p)ppGpp synthetase/guanosine-3',5'-bis(diphosphate) 3'-pyrophosphohydrolase [Saprospiraceae bacterium]HPG06575.1 RelA/SpoT family protein [Saprospiraceae bacterium]
MEEVLLYTDADRVLIQRAYRKLLRTINKKATQEDRADIRRAYEMAVEAHARQRRKSGEPYILHPIEVARICVEEIGLGPTAVVCALLHDVVEDTDVSLTEVRKEFGNKIAMIVDGLTKLDGLYNVESPQAENFKKVVSTLVQDVRVVLIKMADRLHNLRTIDSMPRQKQLKIAAETSYIYSPLAHRLGLYNIKTEFQDICLRIMEPEIYQDIADKLEDSKKLRDRYINEFIKPLRKALDSLKVPYRINGRPKSISSILNKIRTKKVPFEEIFDLYAIRIIVDVTPEREKSICWQVYSIVTDVHTPIPERLKDWITTPKSNGYESLHTTVIGPKGRFVEVQIRSERMDEISERGFAAHWKYKGVQKMHNLYENWLDNIREILDSPHTDALEFINDFKTSLFNEEVYVYTPKGEMKIYPKGATALDFAFGIHSDVGSHCVAIKVNNKLVPMGYKLQNGDQLQVITGKNQKPSEDWLKLVATGKAKAKIRQSLKEEKRQKGEYGKEALERKLRNMKAEFEDNIDMLVKFFGFKSRMDLYFAIATESISLNDLRQFEVEGGKLVQRKPEAPVKQPVSLPPTEPRETTGVMRGVPKLIINGEPGEVYNYKFATCCEPVMGDDIFGYITINDGLKIHRTTCPNAMHLMANYGYRIVKAEWVYTQNTSYTVELVITGIDDGPGVIERISHLISSTLGLNIRSFTITGSEGFFEGRVSVIVNNIDQVNHAIITLKKMPGISNVIRSETN